MSMNLCLWINKITAWIIQHVNIKLIFIFNIGNYIKCLNTLNIIKLNHKQNSFKMSTKFFKVAGLAVIALIGPIIGVVLYRYYINLNHGSLFANIMKRYIKLVLTIDLFIINIFINNFFGRLITIYCVAGIFSGFTYVPHALILPTLVFATYLFLTTVEIYILVNVKYSREFLFELFGQEYIEEICANNWGSRLNG